MKNGDTCNCPRMYCRIQNCTRNGFFGSQKYEYETFVFLNYSPNPNMDCRVQICTSNEDANSCCKSWLSQTGHLIFKISETVIGLGYSVINMSHRWRVIVWQSWVWQSPCIGMANSNADAYSPLDSRQSNSSRVIHESMAVRYPARCARWICPVIKM